MTKTLIERIDLFKTQGSADKEYHLQLFEVDGGFMVEYQNGRRGGTLQAGLKTAKPVEREAAQKLFDKVKKEKLRDGLGVK